MPLPAPAPREELHRRQIDVRGYRRNDGLLDVEATIIDTKSYAFTLDTDGRHLQAGDALHSMTVRLTFDEHYVVQEAVAVTDASPHATICPGASAAVAGLKGLAMAAGWNRAVRERLGGAKGCTHELELLGQMATVAFQTLAPLKPGGFAVAADAGAKPNKIDSCYAYASNRPLVLKRWPTFYDGPDTDGSAPAAA